jgi:HSP20 family molecular chaperone IbpA
MANELTVQESKGVETQERVRPGRVFTPRVDIAETEQALWVWADMPGVNESSVEVSLENDLLSIEGHVSADDYESLEPVYTEYNVGNFVRSFRLSSEIDLGRIRAKMTHGVLELELPKTERAQPRRIEIQAG